MTRRAWWPRADEWLAPAASGFILALSYPPLHSLLPPFVGLVPLALWLHALPADREGSWAAVRGGAVFGVAYFGLMLYWLLFAVGRFTPLAVPAFLTVVGTLALAAGAVCRLLHVGLHGARLPVWVVLPVVWTAFEWGLASVPGTMAFSWLGLGTALTGFPRLVGIAEVVGSRGVTFWLALVNGLVATAILRRGSGGAAWRLALAAVVVGVGPAAWGVHRAARLDLRVAARVAVVQPNVSEEVRLTDASDDSTITALNRLLPTLGPGEADLVALPEVLFRTASAERVLGSHVREAGAPFLFGAIGRDSITGAVHNSALALEPGGLADFRYDKRRLVPFAERVPFLPGGSATTLERFGSYAAGVGWPLYDWADTSFGVLICYESAFPEIARQLRLEGADVLVNITNDAWFGTSDWLGRTSALWQHPAHLVMRAIENRVGIARAANTGLSLYVDPVGRVHDVLELEREGVGLARVQTTGVLTTYSRHGDLVGPASGALAVLVLLLGLKGVRRGQAGVS